MQEVSHKGDNLREYRELATFNFTHVTGYINMHIHMYDKVWLYIATYMKFSSWYGMVTNITHNCMIVCALIIFL